MEESRTAWTRRRGPVALVVGGLVTVIAAIGWLDHATGPEIGFSLFYLLPVLAAGWWFGMPAALIASTAASVAWLLADEVNHAGDHLLVTAWNGFTRVAIFTGIGWLAAHVRGGRDRLAKLLDRERELGRVDLMTDLPNRRGFIERLLMEASRCRRSAQPICLAYLDLDNFKRVNDRYGHAAGDALLSQIGRAIRSTIRAGDLAARLGGDEFAILFWNADRAAVETIARRLIESVREVGRSYPEAELGASVGIAYFESVPDSTEEILSKADGAMYEAKSEGKGRLVIWRAEPQGSSSLGGGHR